MTTVEQTAIERVLQQADELGIRHMRALINDQSGITRVKIVTRKHMADSASEGIGMSSSFGLVNAVDHFGTAPHLNLAVGEIRLMPDLDTFVALPYASGQAAVLVDMFDLDGHPFSVCPRTFLKSQVKRLTERGFQARIGQENEWYFTVTDQDGAVRPACRNPFYGALALYDIGPALTAVIEALESQGMEVAQYHPEGGDAQCEVSIATADPVTAADQQILLRETVKGVARQFGLRATLAPKPFLDELGNGSHAHLSLWDREGERNAFFDPSDRFNFSELGYQFMAGVLHHLPGLVSITSPTVNSYTRLQPGWWSSAYACWGFQNREAPLRVVHGVEGTQDRTVNLEIKSIDASCCPYLALGAIIAAGLDGIEHSLRPPQPLDVAPGSLNDEERSRLGIRPFPTTLDEAIDALERDDVLVGALGKERAASYISAKRVEAAFFAHRGQAFELDQYRMRF